VRAFASGGAWVALLVRRRERVQALAEEPGDTLTLKLICQRVAADQSA